MSSLPTAISPPGAPYEGERRVRCGRGTQTWTDGSHYEGDYENGQRHGRGVHVWKNGERYEGCYAEDRRHGVGVYVWPDGARYEGEFVRDKKEGKGTFLFPSGNRFEGQYVADERLGYGVLTYVDDCSDVGIWNGHRLARLQSRSDRRRKKGPLELASEELIRLAGAGDVIGVGCLLEKGDVDVNVADSCGNTSLMAASTHCHVSVILVLLDAGADVNRLNDVGMSALSSCFDLLYSSLGGGGSQRKSSEIIKAPTVRLAVAETEAKPFDLTDIKMMDRLSLLTRDGRCCSAGYHSTATGRRSPTVETTRERRARSDSGLTESESENDDDDGENDYCSPMELRRTIEILLHRGADPDGSTVPIPPLFYAIKAKDISMLKLLLKNGASTSAKDGGEAVLHVAARLSGRRALRVLVILLKAGANSDARQLNASGIDPYLSLRQLQRRASVQTTSSTTSRPATATPAAVADDDGTTVVGQTPLHIASARIDDHQVAFRISDVLIRHGANPNVIAYGHSPLSLAIGTGNDKIIDLLLKAGADPNLLLGRGIGSALCAVTALNSQRRRSPQASIELINRLVVAGADVFLTVPISLRISTGTVVDYAHWAFNRDKHISQLPYKALTKDERSVYNGRMKVLHHVASLLREKASEREANRLARLAKEASVIDVGENEADAQLSPSPVGETDRRLGRGYSVSTISELALEEAKQKVPPRSPMFTTTIDGKKARGILPRLDSRVSVAMGRSVSVSAVERARTKSPFVRSVSERSFGVNSREKFAFYVGESLTETPDDGAGDKRVDEEFRFCNHCGKSSGVKLVLCRRAFYCSRTCKKKGWESRHRNECNAT